MWLIGTFFYSHFGVYWVAVNGREGCPPFGCWEKKKKIHSGVGTVFLLYCFWMSYDFE
jgi:hypothetical protein